MKEEVISERKPNQIAQQMSRNPYHDDGVQPSHRPSVLLYMDILGHQAMMMRKRSPAAADDKLRELYGALEAGRKWLENADVLDEIRNWGKKDSYALKAFTDNIVMGWPIRDDAESELGGSLPSIALFQFTMIKHGFFVRGAISIGSAYVDHLVVFGDALWQSYEGETTIARDPRIVLMPSAVSAVRKHLKYYAHPFACAYNRELMKDSDGIWFVNYLSVIFIGADEHGPMFHELHAHKETVENMLKKYSREPSIWAKYAWVAGYHNAFCDAYLTKPQGDEHKIEVELFRRPAELIVKGRRRRR